MARDKEIQRIFETADDSLHGLIGYHIFTTIAVESSSDELLKKRLPPDTIRITPEWVRNYKENELLSTIRDIFLPVQTRISIVSMAGIFNAALENFLSYLPEDKINKIHPGSKRIYRNQLEWAFLLVKNSKFGEDFILKQLPEICRTVDHARRLRNIIVHNHGNFDYRYENDHIPIDSLDRIFHSSFLNPIKTISGNIIFIPNENDFEIFLTCHIRLLHFVHNEIQLQFFGHPDPYNYATEGKGIEWHKLLLGD